MLYPVGFHSDEVYRELTSALPLPVNAIADPVRGGKAETVAPALGAADPQSSIAIYNELVATDRMLGIDHEIPALIRALDGKFIRPAPGGDLLRTPAILPTSTPCW